MMLVVECCSSKNVGNAWLMVIMQMPVLGCAGWWRTAMQGERAGSLVMGGRVMGGVGVDITVPCINHWLAAAQPV